MRFPVPLLTALLVVVGGAAVQAAEPTMRPALVGSGPDALVNKIDIQDLFKKGQKDGAVMFACVVEETGAVSWNTTYRPTPNSQALEHEVLKQLPTAKFVPAVYNGKPADVVFFGSVFFSVINGKPHLRVFANQETEELKKQSDFVGPQPVLGGESQFSGVHYPSGQAVMLKGVAEIRITVDAAGKLTDIQLVSEDPPFVRFGQTAMDDFRVAKFIPAYRDGKPTDSRVTLAVYFIPPEG